MGKIILIPLKLKSTDIRKENREWYVKAKKEGLLPIETLREFRIRCGYKDFSEAQHSQWFIELLKQADFLLTCKAFTVTLTENTIFCTYSNSKTSGDFTIGNSKLLSPEQKNNYLTFLKH